jgi:hypothetical protein
MKTNNAVTESVKHFLAKASRPILFAGAGVSLRAGLPTWGTYLELLAEQIRPRDQLGRHQMLQCLQRREYTRAAEYFFLSDGLTDGEKLSALKAPLLEYDVTGLQCIGRLPFAAYVTTNYDRALLDVYARQSRKASIEVNLGDPSMTAAPYEESFYVARIHGRVEVPETIILSKSHYERLHQNAAYIDLLRHLFCTRSLLFVGFSFLDPAVTAVLRAIRDQIGAIHAGRHIALADNTADAEFLGELNRHNIQIVRYDSADGHRELWDALNALSDRPAKTTSQSAKAEDDAFSYARRYFAAVLTRRKMTAHMRPLTQAVAEGMVYQMLLAAGAKGMNRSDLSSCLSEQLHLHISAGDKLVDSCLQGLATDSLYYRGPDGHLFANDPKVDVGGLKQSIHLLVEGAVQRLIVREGGTDKTEVRKDLATYFEYLVLRRGWDMGAAYAARRPPNNVLVEEIFSHMVRDGGTIAQPVSKELIRAIEGVLLSPSDEEAAVLSELGRLAFALELVRQAPQDALFSSHVLPNRIYLDANVLLPAIVKGHPYHELYSAAMEKLLTASTGSSIGLEVCAYFGFLNEVVSHKRLAQDEMVSYGPAAQEYIERSVRLYGATNLNVFIAGFARTLIGGQKLSFDDYLAQNAPYQNEIELAAWLRRRGFRVVDQKQMQLAAREYPRWLHHFEVYFADDVVSRNKTALLVSHDALQIAALMGDITRGDRAVLVTADKRLRDAVAYSGHPTVGSSLLSGVGLVQMIELLVGAVGDERAMAQLLWSTSASSPAERVRRYLVDMALNQYDAALAMNMESVISEITEEITFAMENDSEKKQASGQVISLGRYVESFEPRFYEQMRAVQEKLRKQE